MLFLYSENYFNIFKMQQKYHVGNIENWNPLLAVVLLSHDWMKSCSTKETSL